MKVSDLIAQLQQMPEEAEVRLAHQPSWPFEYAVGDVALARAPKVMSFAEHSALPDEEQEAADKKVEMGQLEYLNEGEEAPIDLVYIGEGRQLGYLSDRGVHALEWGR